jgi:hypothetical protein
LLLSIRVTRLGDFLTNRLLLPMGRFSKIIEVAQLFLLRYFLDCKRHLFF